MLRKLGVQVVGRWKNRIRQRVPKFRSETKGVQVVGRQKNRIRQRVPKFTSARDVKMKILVNSCICEVVRIVMEGGKTESSRVYQ